MEALETIKSKEVKTMTDCTVELETIKFPEMEAMMPLMAAQVKICCTEAPTTILFMVENKTILSQAEMVSTCSMVMAAMMICTVEKTMTICMVAEAMIC